MILDEEGIDLDLLKELKENQRARLTEYVKYRKNAKYIPVSDYPKGRNAVWSVPCFAKAFPSATQNELNLEDAKELIKMVVFCVKVQICLQQMKLLIFCCTKNCIWTRKSSKRWWSCYKSIRDGTKCFYGFLDF